MRTVIAGAGVGGLTAALRLHAAGYPDIRILEADSKLRHAGQGINILPNAVRELDALGLLDRLRERAVLPGTLGYYNRFGSVIWRERRGIDAGYRWPQLSIPREWLHQVLSDAVRDRLGPATITADARVTGFEHTPDGRVTVSVAHRGADAASTVSGDVVVGADGIHSSVRAAMYPAEGPPCWNGFMVWRGVSRHEAFLDGRTMILGGDRSRRVLAYPMSPGDRPGTALINWAVAKKVDGPDAAANWNRVTLPEEFIGDYSDIRLPWLDIQSLIKASGQAYVSPMVDRQPLESWTRGRVTLLGDAAHAMQPAGSNGATQSIVDASALAEALSSRPDPDVALVDYESARRPAMTRLQRSNREMGPESMIDIVDRLAPDGFSSVDDVIPRTELARISANYARLGAFDTDTVNNGARRPDSTVPAGAAPKAGLGERPWL